MNQIWTRRQLLCGTFGTLIAACAPRYTARPEPKSIDPRERPEIGPHSVAEIAEIEKRVGGRVGVFALDTGTGRQLTHRPDERFAMCSTFKWVLAAAVLARVDRGDLSLEDRIPYSSTDLLEYAPVAREHAAEGTMTVDTLAQAAVGMSDNTAANLLLATIDGPSGLTKFVRILGDTVTRFDRDEPTLNDNAPGDPRDTTSPRAMVILMRELLCGDALSTASRERLLQWMRACDTGRNRLRAGLPAVWTAGDKTGTGPRGSVNDVAIAWPPGRSAILIAAYLSDGDADLETLVAAHADIGSLVAREL